MRFSNLKIDEWVNIAFREQRADDIFTLQLHTLADDKNPGNEAGVHLETSVLEVLEQLQVESNSENS